MAIINLWNDRQSIARDVAIETTTSTQNGIYTGWDTIVERCDIRTAAAIGVVADGSELSVVRNNIIVGCDTGIWFGSSASGERCHDNYIYHLDDNGTHDGIYVRGFGHQVHDNYLMNCRIRTDNLDDTLIGGNRIDGWSKSEYVDGLILIDNASSSTDVAICDNFIVGIPSTGIGIHVAMKGGTLDGLAIDGNYIANGGDYGILVKSTETSTDYDLRNASFSRNEFRNCGAVASIAFDLTTPTINAVWDQINVDDNVGSGYCKGVLIDTGVGYLRSLSVAGNRLGGDIRIGKVYSADVSRNTTLQEIGRDGGIIEILEGNSVTVNGNHLTMPSWIDSWWVSEGVTAVIAIVGGENNVIHGNSIAGRYVPNIAAIGIGGKNATVTDNTYTGRLYDGAWETDDLAIGIRIDERATDIRVRDNDMRKIVGEPLEDNSVRGYGLEVLSSFGTAFFDTSETVLVIDHGLSVEPSSILATPTADERVWVSESDATTFILNRPPGRLEPMLVSWRADGIESAEQPPIDDVHVIDDVTFKLTVARTVTDAVGVTDTVGTVEA